MSPTTGRVAVVGAGVAGLATAISLHQAGHDVSLFDRAPEVRPLGYILNLWPAPIRALHHLGADVEDIGAPCQSEFRRSDGRRRVAVHVPPEVQRDFGGGLFGLLRPQMYRRLLDALPAGILHPSHAVERIEDAGDRVTLHLAGRPSQDFDLVVGADGINSVVRRALWGDSPVREHNLHVLGGYTFAEVPGAPTGLCVVSHDRTVQGSWSTIRHEGRTGHQWWVLTAHDARTEFTGDVYETARGYAQRFASPLPELAAATDPENVIRWQIRDRRPLAQWSKGRVTLVGDAAHPTSPYAAYGAGMAIEDGYFLGRRLAGVDLGDVGALRRVLQDFEDTRKPHTRRQVQSAYVLGQVFHHVPRPLQPLRDAFLDHTPLLQKQVGDRSPREIADQLAVIEQTEQAFRPLPR